jgi:predicted permease
MSFYRRLLNVFRSGGLDREFDEELQFPGQMRLRESAKEGVSPALAEEQVKRRMGNLSLTPEEMRDARVVGSLASSLQDLRHGVVLLRRDAGVSALIVLVLAIGIGGNATMFTFLQAAFLDPLPYRESDRLVTVVEERGANPSVSEYLEIRARSRTLEQVTLTEHRDMQVSGVDEPVRVFAARVTASFFPLLGVRAAMGRTFAEEEDQPGRTPAVVLTDAFWRKRMSSDPGAIGRTLRLDGHAAVVVGVLPAGFHFDYPTLRISEPVDIYVSLPTERSVPFRAGGTRTASPFRILARLSENAARKQSQSELQNLGRALTAEYPAAYRNRDGAVRRLNLDVIPLREAIVGRQRSLLTLLFGCVGVLLLIACANTAQLLLARSLRRSREVAVRTALGATRLRLIRQFVLEGVVLAVCGGAAGLIASNWMMRLFLALLPGRSPVLETAHLDMRVVAFTLAVSLISAMLFALIPAIKGSKSMPTLNARPSAGEGSRLRHTIVALETSLSVLLLCGAGIVAQNLWTLISTPIGFEPDQVLAFRLKAPPGQNMQDSKSRDVFADYLRKISAIPGVESAATVTGPPLRPSVSGPAELVGVTDAAGKLRSVTADNHLVSSDYFRVLRIPLLAGRAFREGDGIEPWKVAIVNEEFARRFGFGRDIVGKQIFEPGQPMTIVGMVANVRTRGLEATAFPEVYLPALRFSWTNQYLVVRSAIPPEQLIKQVTAAIRSSNSEQVVYGVMTMEELIADAVTEPRFHVFLIGMFALLAVAMAGAGLYSVISCLVAQRTSEIAIRIALGASGSAITRAVLGTTMMWIAGGLAAGLVLSLAMRDTVRTLSRTAGDGSPWVYVFVLFFFFAVTLIAAYVPLRRARGLDPSVALRSE